MVSAEILRQGAWYALEQAGRLLHAAAVLADDGQPITGAAVAMFGREELDQGGVIEPAEVRRAYDNHSAKQTEGALSVTLRTARSSGAGAATWTMSNSKPGSQGWKAAREHINSAIEAKRKHDPRRRHMIRMAALYVDLNDDGSGWSRPCCRDEAEARNEIVDAVGDYAVQRDKLRDEVLAEDYPEMARARASMPAEFTLLPPRWPALNSAS
jgi:hypothetical protein